MSTPSENLSAYLDGELTESEARAVEVELAQDPTLRAELDLLRETVDFMQMNGPVHAPPDFFVNVIDAVENEKKAVPWWRKLTQPFGFRPQGLAVLAVAALVLVIAIPFGAQQLVLNKSGEMKQSGRGDLAWSDQSSESSSRTRSAPPTTVAQTDSAGSSDAKEADKIITKNGDAANDYEQNVEPAGSAAKVTNQMAQSGELLNQIQEKTKSESAQSLSKSKEEMLASSVKPTKQAPGNSATTMAVTGYEYVITTDDPEVLYALNALVSRYGGKLVEGNNNSSLKPRSLSGSQQVDVRIAIHEKNLNAFDRQLTHLGTIRRILPQDMELTTGGAHALKVQITYDGRSYGKPALKKINKAKGGKGYETQK
jgi:negative regulator of sigma E activity